VAEQTVREPVAVSSARDLVVSYIDRFAAYHSQKETMTWSAATLYVVAVSVLLATGREPFWYRAPWWKFWPFVALLAATAYVAFAFVHRQFQRRLASHLLVHACSNVAVQWLTREPTVAECQPQSLQEHGFGAEQDYQLVPAAVTDELKRMAERKREHPQQYKYHDRRTTFILMSLWTAAALARLLSSWQPIAELVERWSR